MSINKAQISDRAMGPSVPMSYKGIAKKRSKANGGEAPAIHDFLTESQRGQTIEFTLTNKTPESKIIAVFPGRLNSVAEISKYAGVRVDAIAAEGDFLKQDENVLVTCSSKTLDLAKGWFRDHPTRFSKIKLQTNDEAQFAHELQFAGFALGKTTGTVSVRPIEHVSLNQMQKTMAEINMSMQLDDATVMIVEIGGNKQLSISMQIVTELNTAEALSEIVEKLEA